MDCDLPDDEPEAVSTFHWWRLWATVYLAFLLFIRLALAYAEEWWPGYLILYLPALVWLLPGLPLAVGAVFRDRKALLLLAVCALFWLFGIAGFELNGAPRQGSGGKVLKVVTNNVGENNETDVYDFWKREDADFLVLQDAFKRMPSLRGPHDGYHSRQVGQHFLMSRYPIVGARLLPVAEWPGGVVACFVVEVDGRKIHLYSVHTPTVRRDFSNLWYGDRQNNPLDKRIEIFRELMARRKYGLQRLAEMLVSDSEPALVVGDFNSPAWGMLPRLFQGELQDAFKKCGNGFGYTFPAYDPYLPTWFGPWLRIDYAFCNKSWRPLSCAVETNRESQHRAVSATFELTR